MFAITVPSPAPTSAIDSCHRFRSSASRSPLTIASQRSRRSRRSSDFCASQRTSSTGTAYAPRKKVAVTGETSASRTKTAEKEMLRIPSRARRWITRRRLYFEVQSRRMPHASDAGLVRAIGARQLTASIINVTIGAGIFVLPAAVNVRGVKPGVRLVEAMTVAKLLPLVVLVVCGIWFVHPEYLRWPGMPAVSAIGQTAIVLIFAFVGLEIALVPSGEVRDPARTVPRALFSALAITTTLYLLIQTVAQGLLGPAMATFSAAPLAEAASRVLGHAGRLIVLVGAIVSMFGYLSGDLLRSPPTLFAFARDGLLQIGRAHV